MNTSTGLTMLFVTALDSRSSRPRFGKSGTILWYAKRTSSIAHPQDYVRGVRDIQSVPDPRPGAPDSNTHNETTLDAAEAAGQTVISVAATTNMQAGDSILIELDDSTFHLSTISSFVAGDTVTIADALPSKAASGNKVVIASAQTSENDL